MPLNLQKNLPAVELLKKEHIFVMDSLRASEQDIRPLRVVVLNLMPLKITTETDLVRLLSNTPLQVELDFMKIKGHTPKNTPIEHMKEFYKDFDEMQDDFYDGMIITGAPVEQMPFEEVNYWEEVTEIFDWARTHVTSTLYICWAAQAGLYHFYGVPKYDLPAKMFGVFRHTLRELCADLPRLRRRVLCAAQPAYGDTPRGCDESSRFDALVRKRRVWCLYGDGARRTRVFYHWAFRILALHAE